MKKILLLILIQNSLISSYSQNFAWAKAMVGPGGFDESSSIITDASGNVYTTGRFTATVDFDPGVGIFNLTSAGSNDIFISKLNASGNFVWAKKMGGTGSDYAYSIALDGSGNVYTTGSFNATVDFDPGAGVNNLTSAGFDDIFVSKLDASGNFVWAKKMGGTSGDYAYSIALDGSGNVLTTGAFGGTADFDPGVGIFNLTSAVTAIFISKLDASGNFVWAKKMGGTGGAFARSLALDASGNVYTTGYFSATVDFDPGAGVNNLTSAGIDDIFVSKLDASGNFVWAKKMGGTGSDYAYSIALDGSGNVLTTGAFSGTADFDPSSSTTYLTAIFEKAIFVSKLDASGNFVWAKAMQKTVSVTAGGGNVGTSICADASGNIYTTGGFQETTDFDPSAGVYSLTAPSSAANCIFISKLDTSGNFLWAGAFGGTNSCYGWSIYVNTSSNIYTTGFFGATVDFDPSTSVFNLTAGVGGNDSFVLKLASSCSLSASVSQTNVSCNGLSNGSATIATAGGTPGYTYSWSPSGGTGVTASALSAGSYTCAVTDANSCTAAQSFVITQPNALMAMSSSTAILCNGGSSTVTVNAMDGTAPYTGTGIFSASAGTYAYPVTDANGCSASTTGTITEPAAITGIQSPSICIGENYQVGTSTYTTVGTYTDILTAANGCDSTVTTNLTVNSLPSLSVAAADTNVCVSSSAVSLIALPLGGTWTGAGIVGSTFSPSIAAAGTHIITYTYTDINACANTAQITMVVNLCTGINVVSNAAAFTVYPNPTNSTLTINTSLNYSSIQIINMLGQLVFRKEKSTSLNVSSLPSGIYFIQLVDIKGSVIGKEKFVKE